MSTDTAIDGELAAFAEAAKELQAALNRIPDRRSARLIHALVGVLLWFAGILTGAAGVLAVHHSEIISTIKENHAAIEALRESLDRAPAGSRSGK